ncbi:ABC transporter substrate-binding protein [Candidatus Bathyarchaeota archaeon]|nr:ABC transporter substrate-binding protein [Candidatus Bathyarchaeota archaeon]
MRKETYSRKKRYCIAGIMLASLLLFAGQAEAAPPISRPMQFWSITDPGAAPETVDPAWCYDNPSAELIFNVYETLVFCAESMSTYISQLATGWTVEQLPPGTTSPDGLPWYYRYTFTIRPSVPFQDSDYGVLTPLDVEYSFERAMVQSRHGGPAWTLYEPLLNVMEPEELVPYGNLQDPPNAHSVGLMIDHAIESDATHVWFNLAFPGPYSPFLQILSQPWCSILSKQWINDLIGSGRPDWNGNWGDYIEWVSCHDPGVSPLDYPSYVMMGTGPFYLGFLDYTLQMWSIHHFEGYWRGWPANWPSTGGQKPGGYVYDVDVSWGFYTMEASSLFLSGDVDFWAVPRVVKSWVLGAPGIRCYYPLPTLALDAVLFNFNVDVSSPGGYILPADTFSEIGVPSNLFEDIEVRKAFAHLFDYESYLNFHYDGEGVIPATAIIPGLLYYDPSVTPESDPRVTPESASFQQNPPVQTQGGYEYDLTTAIAELQGAWGGQLWANGFTIPLYYQAGSWARRHIMEFIAQGLGLISMTAEPPNPKIHFVLIPVPSWPTYLSYMRNRYMPIFAMGWEADYPDAHNFAFPFYCSTGTLARYQGYSNPTMDALIWDGIRTPDGPERALIYHDIQVLALQDCPNIPVIVPVGRHFERDWVVGWYYNPIYGGSLAAGIESTSPVSNGLYFYNMWKWYYIPHALQSTPTQPTSNYLPYDTNYDGKIDMKDIAVVCRSFGAYYCQPMHPRWNYRCDVSNDRKIDVKDVAAVAKNFGKASPVWVPP